jgi:hypothetical protein
LNAVHPAASGWVVAALIDSSLFYLVLLLDIESDPTRHKSLSTVKTLSEQS